MGSGIDFAEEDVREAEVCLRPLELFNGKG